MGTSRGGHTIAGFPASHLGNLLEHIKFIQGPGSGINADTVDGIEGAAIITIDDVSTSASANKLLRLNSSGVLPASITGNAATATKLQTSRTIALSGDVTGSVSFDGTGNVTISTSYKNSGVTAGTYRSVTVDAKGNVTAGTNPTTISGYGITDAFSKSGGTLTGDVTISKDTPTITLYDSLNGGNTGIIKFGSAAAQGVQIRYTANDGEIIEANGYAIIVEKSSSNTQDFKTSFQVEGNIYANGSKVLTVADEGSGKGIDADTVDGVHLSGLVQTSDVVTSPAANKILKLNGSSKLPASITGDADTVDGKHVDDGQNGSGYLWTANKTYTELQKIIQTSSATLAATAGWYRIAQSPVGILQCSARFEIDWRASGNTGQLIFNAAIMYGKGITLTQTLFSNEGSTGITKARIVYHTTASGNYAYLEIYDASALSTVINVQMLTSMGWSLITPTTGSIPSGYSNREISFIDGISTEGILKSTVATGTSPLQVSSTTVVSNLNADMLDGLHESSFARKAITLTGGTGITTSIGDLSANRTINFDTTWGDARYSGIGHSHAFNNLSDVTVSSPTTGHTIRYNGSSWVNTFPSFNDNSDITLSSPASGHILQHDGSKWVNRTLSSAGIAASSVTLTGGNGIVTSIGNLTANRTINVDFAGTGSANTVARSDHSHAYQKYPLTQDAGWAQNASTDWNNYGDTGFYMAQNLTNQGPGSHTWKHVISLGHNSSYSVQLSVDFDATSLGMRAKSNGVWKAWKELWHDGNFDPSTKANASVTLTGGNGIVTSIGNLSANRTISVDFGGNGSANTVSRSDHTHNVLNTQGTKTAPTGRSVISAGIYSYSSYNDTNTPVSYGEVMSFGDGTGGHAEILVSWAGVPKVYVRSLRDTTDNWTAWKQMWTEDSFDPSSKANASVTLTGGTGIVTSIGNLTANRTISLDTSYTDGRYATLSGGNSFSGSQNFNGGALLGIGTLTSTGAVQGTQLRSTVATGTSPLTVSSTTVVTNLNADMIDGVQLSGLVQTSRTISTGTGLSGGGNLTANRTFSFDTSWGDSRYATLAGGNSFTSQQSFGSMIVVDRGTAGRNTWALDNGLNSDYFYITWSTVAEPGAREFDWRNTGLTLRAKGEMAWASPGGMNLNLIQTDSDNGLYNYIGFSDKYGTWKSYIGYNSSKNNNFYVYSSTGDVVLSPSGASNAYVNGNRILTDNGDTLSGKYTFKGSINITGNDGDADWGSSNNGAILLGSTSGINMAIDSNEIFARNNGVASTFYINASTVYMLANLRMGTSGEKILLQNQVGNDAYIGTAIGSTRQLLQIRSSAELSEGSGIDFYGNSDSNTAMAGGIRIYTNGTDTIKIEKAGRTYVYGDVILPNTGTRLQSGNVYMNGYNSIVNDTTGIMISGAGSAALGDSTSTGRFYVASDSTGDRIFSMSIYNRTYSGSANMFITNQGTLGIVSSARKYKISIEDINQSAVDNILNLRPRTWIDRASAEVYSDLLTREANGEVIDWDSEDVPALDRFTGFIAEEVEEVGLAQFVVYKRNKDGVKEVESLQYDRLWVPLVPVIKQNTEDIKQLKSEVKSLNVLKDEVVTLKQEITTLKDEKKLLEEQVNYQAQALKELLERVEKLEKI